MTNEKDKKVISDANHIKYCCAVHGCKYDNDFCPVVYGLADQQLSCSECEKEKNNNK